MQDILQLTEGNKSNLWTFIHIFRFQFFTVKISGGKKIIVVLNNENKVLLESHQKHLAICLQNNRIHFKTARCKIVCTGIKDAHSTYEVEYSALKNCDSEKVFGFHG